MSIDFSVEFIFAFVVCDLSYNRIGKKMILPSTMRMLPPFTIYFDCCFLYIKYVFRPMLIDSSCFKSSAKRVDLQYIEVPVGAEQYKEAKKCIFSLNLLVYTTLSTPSQLYIKTGVHT